MTWRKLLILTFLTGLTVQLSAQNDPLENFKFNLDSTKERSSGSYYGYGAFLGENAYSYGEVSYADQFSIIGRTMFGEEEAAVLKLGMSYYYDFSSYYLKNNTFPFSFEDQSEIKRQKFVTQSIGVDLFARLNFNKNNEKSLFLDLGFYGSFNVVRKYKILLERNQDLYPFYDNQKLVHKNVSYLQKFNYGPVVRFGLDKIHLVANYRLSNIFEDDVDGFAFGEMPRIFVGINLGI